MFATDLGDIQRLNYSILSSIRDAARADIASACCRFGMAKKCLEVIRDQSPDAMLTFVEKVGPEALFKPRHDLATLLKAPEAVLPMLASASNNAAAFGAESDLH